MSADLGAAADAKSWLYHPKFPDHWKRKPLYDLADWVNGLAFRDIQFSTTGKPVIKIAEIKGGISSQTKFTTQTFDESVHVTRGDLLFSWSGQPETSIDAFWWRGPDGWLNQHVFKVIPKSILRRTFFFYLLRYLKPNFIGIARNKQTTGLGHVTKWDLGNIEAAYPEDDEEQRAIAGILGTLDDKIELNRQMNETLEAMARVLFKSWFVDFDPVRAKAEGRGPGLSKPLADLFPDSFEDSEIGMIPKGWYTGNVGNLCSNIYSGGTPSTQNSDYWDGDIPWLSSGETRAKFITDTERRITPAGVSNSSTRLAPTLSTVIASAGQGNTRGQTSLLTIESYVNQSVVVLTANPSVSSHCHLFFDLERRYQEFRRVSDAHSSRGSLTTKLLAGLPAILPPGKLVQRFESLVMPEIERITKNLRESCILAALRDTLLPMLISGELPVEKAERFIGEDA